MSNSTNATGASGDPLVFDPSKPVPYWHQDLELAFICIFNGLTLLLIVSRVTLRRMRLKRFRKDDVWMMVAGVLLVFPHWVCQIGTNRFGSGLHVWNVPDSWHIPFFEFEWGWVGYYIVSSMIKVSVCASLLEILPPQFVKFRTFVYMLCGTICSLGIAEACVWLFQCQPFLSNFVYEVEPVTCLDIDAARYAWVGVSVLIDLAIVCIPFLIIRRIRLKVYERLVLFIVFGANLLGTLACAFNIYGIWQNSNSFADVDDSYTESVYIMTSDVEIFLYTLGASATMASRYFINKAGSMSNGSPHASHPSWRRPTISWPTTNDSFNSEPTVRSASTAPTASTSPSKFQQTREAFGFTLKRGFKSQSVEMLEEGIIMDETPKQRRPTFASLAPETLQEQRRPTFASLPLETRQEPRVPYLLMTDFDGAMLKNSDPHSALTLNDVSGLAHSPTDVTSDGEFYGRGAAREKERWRRKQSEGGPPRVERSRPKRQQTY